MAPGILLINYHFPPLNAVGALRNHHIASQFAARGYRVFVLTTSNRRLGVLRPLPFPPEATIYDLPTIDYQTLRARLTMKRSGRRAPWKASPILDFLRRIKETAPFSLVLDEGGPLYIHSALRRAKTLIRQHNIEFLYSSYRPRADHLIAHSLCHRHPHLRWLADFRDPHVDANRSNVFWPKLQNTLDARLVRSAEVVSTVSSGIANHLKHLHPNVRVLTNGIAPWQQQPFPPPNLPHSKFLITYTGSLYPQHQNPHPLFRAIRSLLNQSPDLSHSLRLVYAGPHSHIWFSWIHAHNLQAIHHDLGHLPLPLTLGLQQASHLNILLNWAGPAFSGILTGKLYEYLASRTPLLTLVNGPLPDPDLESIARLSGGAKVFYARNAPETDIQNTLSHYLHAWHNGLPTTSPVIPDSLKWDLMMPNFLDSIEWP